MKTALTTRATRLAFSVVVLSHFVLSASVLSKVKVTHDPQKNRADYVARMQQQTVPAPTDLTLGSLWSSNGAMTNLQADYKASRLNDLVTTAGGGVRSVSLEGGVTGLGADFIIVDDAAQAIGGKIEERDGLLAAIGKTDITAPRGPVSFDPVTHQAIQNVYVREVVQTDGKLVNKVIDVFPKVGDNPANKA